MPTWDWKNYVIFKNFFAVSISINEIHKTLSKGKYFEVHVLIFYEKIFKNRGNVALLERLLFTSLAVTKISSKRVIWNQNKKILRSEKLE